MTEPDHAPATAPEVGRGAVDEHFEAAYADLRRMARARLHGNGPSRVLDTTALVHESYLRLARQSAPGFPDRARFMAYAGRVMRSVIIDLVRERQAERRGGDLDRVTMSTHLGENLPAPSGEEQILRVSDALDALARIDPRMARVVEMRYFGGLTEGEIATALEVNERTVRRDWQQARLFLADALR
jgi:RNA polymerase sigma factor (TIGR02999 family)